MISEVSVHGPLAPLLSGPGQNRNIKERHEERWSLSGNPSIKGVAGRGQGQDGLLTGVLPAVCLWMSPSGYSFNFRQYQ